MKTLMTLQGTQPGIPCRKPIALVGRLKTALVFFHAPLVNFRKYDHQDPSPGEEEEEEEEEEDDDDTPWELEDPDVTAPPGAVATPPPSTPPRFGSTAKAATAHATISPGTATTANGRRQPYVGPKYPAAPCPHMEPRCMHRPTMDDA